MKRTALAICLISLIAGSASAEIRKSETSNTRALPVSCETGLASNCSGITNYPLVPTVISQRSQSRIGPIRRPLPMPYPMPRPEPTPQPSPEPVPTPDPTPSPSPTPLPAPFPPVDVPLAGEDSGPIVCNLLGCQVWQGGQSSRPRYRTDRRSRQRVEIETRAFDDELGELEDQGQKLQFELQSVSQPETRTNTATSGADKRLRDQNQGILRGIKG